MTQDRLPPAVDRYWPAAHDGRTDGEVDAVAAGEEPRVADADGVAATDGVVTTDGVAATQAAALVAPVTTVVKPAGHAVHVPAVPPAL